MRTSPLLILFLLLFGLTGLSVLVGSRQDYSGDLTRIGALPDEPFRPQQSDTVIPTGSLTNSPINQADIIVIGDSFSAALQWQSILVEAGLKVHTVHWATLENENLSPLTWARAKGAKPETIFVFQIVERTIASQTGFLNRVVQASTHESLSPGKTPKSSAKMKDRQQPNGGQNDMGSGDSDARSTPAPNAPTASADPVPSNTTANKTTLQSPTNRMSTGFRLAFNHLRLARNSDFIAQYPGAPGGTRVSQFSDGCNYFSHTDCTRLLTLAADEKSQRFDSAYRKVVEDLDARLRANGAKNLVWMIVPNKTTVYKSPPTNTDNLDFSRQGMGPNLFREFAEMRGKRKDLYKPDDTHLSNEGSREMGRIAKQHIMFIRR